MRSSINKLALALDSSLGTPQHKKTVLGHMLNYSFNSAMMYQASEHAEKIITTEPLSPNSYVITKLPVFEALFNRYSHDITKMQVISDTQPVIMEGQKQTNYAFIFTIKTKLDHVFGFNQTKKTLDKMQEYKNGSFVRVIPYGYVLDNIVSGSNAKIELKSSPISIEDNDTEKSYHVVTTKIKPHTQIPRYDFDHMLVVKGDSQGDQTVEAIAILTSQSGVKTGVATIENIKLSDTQVSGQGKTQYASIIIPPRIIQTNDCTEIQEGTDYVNKPNILPKIEALDIETSRYEVKPYNTEGFITEKLQQLNDLHDEITKNEEVD